MRVGSAGRHGRRVSVAFPSRIAGFPKKFVRTHFAYVTGMADVLVGLAAWFGASLVLGIFVGKLMAAQDHAPWASDAKQHSSRKAA